MSIFTGWKTILFSTATTLLGALQAAGLTNVVAQYPAYIVMGAGILSFLLRMITKTPPALKISVAKPVAPTPPPAVPTAAATAIAAGQ